MSLALIVNKKMHNITHEWSVLKKEKTCRLDSDKVYARCMHKCLKRERKSTTVIIYIGKDISDLMKFNEGERVNIFLDKNNSYFLKLKKINYTDTSDGYKLCRSDSSHIISISFKCPESLLLPKSPTVELDFDLYSDESILIDLKKLKD